LANPRPSGEDGRANLSKIQLESVIIYIVKQESTPLQAKRRKRRLERSFLAVTMM